MITQEQLELIGQRVAARPVGEDAIQQLRAEFPEVHFTYCMDDDVVAAHPVKEESAFNLYLIDSRQHCLSFTRDMEVATGVVVAEIDEG